MLTLYLLLIDDLWYEEMVMLLLEVVQGFICACFLLQFLYLHLMVVELVCFRIAVFEYFINPQILMQGGLKSNAYF